MHPGRGNWVGWASGWVLGLALLIAPAVVEAASKDVSVDNLRVGFVNSTTNNLFKIGSWTPIWVQVKGGDARFSGTMEIEVPDDGGTPVYYRQMVNVGPARANRLLRMCDPAPATQIS